MTTGESIQYELTIAAWNIVAEIIPTPTNPPLTAPTCMFFVNMISYLPQFP